MAFWKKKSDKDSMENPVNPEGMAESTPAIDRAIQSYIDPYLQTDLLSAGAVKSISQDGDTVRVEIELGYPGAGVQWQITEALQAAITGVDGVSKALINVGWKIEPHRVQGNATGLPNVRNIIAVASGKGGVGKSTTAANIALALSAEGASVGILDADIYGPSQPIMFGVAPGTKPETRDMQYFLPFKAHGIQLMSMGFMVSKDTPMVWRGPMASGALQQMLNQTLWEDLDYLIIDMPPGTGDIHLTLSQSVPVTGSIIVTTPQDMALLDAVKGIEMFRKVDIPVLGIVENMGLHTCSGCGLTEHIFGAGGGEKIAKEYDTQLLGSLPLALGIREQADGGTPTVVAEPDGEIAGCYKEIARRFAANLACRDVNTVLPNIVMVDD